MVVLEALALNTAWLARKAVLYNRDLRLFRLSGKRIVERSDCKKVFALSINKLQWDPPYYMNVGGHAGIGLGVPIGGGNRQSTVCIFTQANLADNKYMNRLILPDIPKSANLEVSRYYLNTADELQNYFQQNAIQSQKIPVQLPLIVEEAHIPPTTPMYLCPEVSILGSDRDEVIRLALRRIHMGDDADSFLFITWCFLVIYCMVDSREQKRRVRDLLSLQ